MSMVQDSVRALLLHLPITDPTGPYHSLVYLASYARANGFSHVDIRDTNIEALTYCAQPPFLRDRKRAWEAELRKLSKQPYLTGLQQLAYSNLTLALALDPEAPSRAIRTLQSEELFFEWLAYREAVSTLHRWLRSLSCDAIPDQFSENFHLRNNCFFNLSNKRDLKNKTLINRIVGPFRAYFKMCLLPHIRDSSYEVIGINVTYISQLPYCIWLVSELREILPDAYIVCGGTEITGMWKSGAGILASILSSSDACVVGEGETAFLRIIQAVHVGKRPGNIPNLVDIQRAGKCSGAGLRLAHEDINKLPTPEYSLLPAGNYFSPFNIVNYSPSRGCYWGRCAFCDYGLNLERATAIWRERALDLIICDLERIAQHSRYVYFAVDAMAPATLVKIADGLIKQRIPIHWASEIRLEKYFDRARCELLRRSGCVAVSVGFESASQRVLTLIKKGIKASDMPVTMRNLSEAEIAVQVMGFTGFPSETHEEALASVNFLREHDRLWTVASVGEFMLTPGSAVAKSPGKFGISNLTGRAGNDIHRELVYQQINGRSENDKQSEALLFAKKRLDRAGFRRPFAGGIDSAHSIFYYSRYGRRFPFRFCTIQEARLNGSNGEVALSLNGDLFVDKRYDFTKFVGVADLRALWARGNAVQWDEVQKELGSLETHVIACDRDHLIFIRKDGTCLSCSPALYKAVEGLGRVMNMVDGMETLRKRFEVDERCVDFIRNLVGLGIITLQVRESREYTWQQCGELM